ncbi:hypothetical protein [uncultured Chryseobacterium sp.]|uniref:hypothetical protein n=1 Tax=uncultured Chryseobacterium sp. TaxID=259322 RepID=UPI0025F6E141|nr:hypothetical protein [uncultured Chryseobacterium sp.]
MRKKIYLIVLSCSLVSCYTYQVKKPADPATADKQESKSNAASSGKTKNQAAETQSMAAQPPVPVNIKQKLVPTKNFKIDVDGKSYKIIVDRWESDSLVAHPVHNPDRVLKFHKNQINAERIAERRFSQPIADIITIAVYAGAGVGIWYLLR